MDIKEAIDARHSVRQYKDIPLEEKDRKRLETLIKQCNVESGLNMQVIYDEPECFSSRMAKYGSFENCKNYVSIVGKKSPDADEKSGYYGELFVLKAQELGLNTCWVALTHGRSRAVISEGETEVIIIALGYGQTQGSERRSKSFFDVSDASEYAPEWFRRGVEAALLAPTAINQQKFRFALNGRKVTAKAGLVGSCLKIDLGIVKCHFELGAGKENFKWAQ